MSNNDNSLKPRGSGSKNNSMFWMYFIVLGILAVIFFFNNDNTTTRDVSWEEFVKEVNDGNYNEVTLYTNTNVAEAANVDTTKRAATPFFSDGRKVKGIKLRAGFPASQQGDTYIQTLRASGKFTGDIYFKEAAGSAWTWVLYFGPILLLIAFYYMMMKRAGGGAGGIFSVGKSRARLFDKKNSVKVTFADVAGQDEAKAEIAEIVDFLKNPKRYTELGGKIPKGALLVGPPGTGKTLLAKAVAGEADVPFLSMSGSDFVEMFVGVGASRVRDLFKQAKEKAPCIVFIDEIDAVGRARGKNPNMSSNDERENTLNQLLTEMDGFGTNSGVIVLAATNRADMLDKALLRAGRFDRQIHVDLPEVADRKAIFLVHLRNVKIDGSVDLDLLARQTPGFSGADIANVCNEAALVAARHNKRAVQRQDFNDAIDRIVGGLEKRSKVMTEEERNSIAVHEAGHATVSWHLRYGDPLIKVTIVPRGKALGAAWYMPEERQITPKEALLDKICSLMAGRVAEEMFLGIVDTGALNDLERATRMAYAMVTYYGMSERIPNVSYYDSSDSYGFNKPYSESRAQEIDNEVQEIINTQYDRARQVLQEHIDGHHQLAELLLQREVIYTEDAERIFGKRPWQSRTDTLEQENNATPAVPPVAPPAPQPESPQHMPPPFKN
ncbi:MAG: ATP-dependent zinc metalloprotease FtsH [Muribaculaceae bacterium]|nr:ATP-dependent zinc metalloprotease FtsH [Muribaculaceae bacterium]